MLADWNWLSFVIGVLFTPLCFVVAGAILYAWKHPEKRRDVAWISAFAAALVLVLSLAVYGLVKIVTG